MSATFATNESQPSFWFAFRAIGRTSEPWLWRQLNSFAEARPKIVCWELHNQSAYPVHQPVSIIDTHPNPQDTSRRWKQRLLNLPSLNFYGSYGTELKKLQQQFEKDRPQAILCHFGQWSLRFLPIAIKYKVPLIAHFHGIDASSSIVTNRWYKASLKHNLNRFAEIIVVGNHQKETLVELGASPSNIHTIPCGAPTENFLPKHDTSRSQVCKFITVSRLEPCKGLDISYEAFKQLTDKRKNAELHIVGSGPLEELLKRRTIEDKLTEKVFFHGSCDQERTKALLRESDIFLQHSINYTNGWIEGFGVSITEASATQLPVIASRCGGIVDQIKDGYNGLLVDQHDVNGMTSAMLDLFDDPQRRLELGKNGRENANNQFNTKILVRKLESVILNAINKNHSPRDH